jgi:type IV pilus assembly protein PilB
MIIKKKLGQMLIEEGLLTEAQLNGALAEHKKSGLKLGQYITRKGMVNENQIVQMLSRQLKIEKYDPT